MRALHLVRVITESEGRVAGTGPGTQGEHLGHADGKSADSQIIVLLFIILFHDIHGNVVP